MALDDYTEGKGLYGLIDKGLLKEDELDNSERVKLRSYKITRQGEGLQGLLQKGLIDQKEIDDTPEYKLAVQAFNTQKGLDKNLFERIAEPDPVIDQFLTKKGVDPNTKAPLEKGLTGITPIDLSGETEPSGIQKFIGENLPQEVLNTLSDMQPTLAVAGETATAGLLKLPKTRKPTTMEEITGFAMGVLPQILITRGTIQPRIAEYAAAKGLNAMQTEMLLEFTATTLSRSAALGVEDMTRPPEERLGPMGIASNTALEGALALGAPAAAAGVGRGLGWLRTPGKFDTVPGFRESLKRAEATLVGTADELPPGVSDDIADLVETEGQRAFRQALVETERQMSPPVRTKAAPAHGTTIVPEEFQSPATRRTATEQEYGIPADSAEPSIETIQKTAASAGDQSPRRAIDETDRLFNAGFRESEGQRGLREALEQTTTPETQPRLPAPEEARGIDIIPPEYQSPEVRRTVLEQMYGLPKGSGGSADDLLMSSRKTKKPIPAPKEAPEAPPEAARATESAPEPEARVEEAPKAKKAPRETYGLEEKDIRALGEREADARVLTEIEDRLGVKLARKSRKEVLDPEKVATAADDIAAGRTPGDKLTRAERKADPALEAILNSRAQKNARAAAKKLGVSDEDLKTLRTGLGDDLFQEETASGAINERKKRVIETILARSTSIDDEARGILQAELDDLTKGGKASTAATAIDESVNKAFDIDGRAQTARGYIDEARNRKVPLEDYLTEVKDADGPTRALALAMDDYADNPEATTALLGRIGEMAKRAEAAIGSPKLPAGVDKINTEEILEGVVRRVANEEDFGTVAKSGSIQKQPPARGAGADAAHGRRSAGKLATPRPRRKGSPLPEPEERDLLEAIEEAEEAIGRRLTDDEIRTIENTLAFKEQAEITLPEGKTSLEKARSTGTEEDAITIIARTRGKKPPSGAAVGAFRQTAASSVDTGILDLPEIVTLAKELSGGKMPVILKRIARGRDVLGFFNPSKGEIALRADIFSEPELAKRVLAHEIGHLVDWLPDHTLARGNILGRVASLKKFMAPELIDAAGTFKNKSMRKELKTLSAIWRPITPEVAASKEMMAYRNSSKELYADAISTLINDPVLLRTHAPEFYKAFDTFLDRKPEFKRIWQELLDLKASGGAVEATRKATRDMIERGEEAFIAKIQDRTTLKQISDALRTAFIDVHDSLLQRVRKIEDRLPATENPRYAIEKALYTGSEVHEHMIQFKTEIFDPLRKAKLDLTDLDELALNRRILADRAELANPLGIDKKRAKEVIAFMKDELGPEKWKALDEIHGRLGKWRKPIIDTIRKSGMYDDETVDALAENVDYVTFNVAKHMNEKYGGYVSGIIHEQVGTFNDVVSPVTATILKDESIIRAVNKNSAIKSTVDFLKKHYPDEIKEAEKIVQISGKGIKHVPKEPTEKGVGMIAYLDRGEVKGFYVDELIADGFSNKEFDSRIMQLTAKALDTLGKPFREAFINKNFGFWAFNTVRDNWRAGTQLPKANLVNRIPHMLKSVKPAWHFATRVPDDVIARMNQNNELISVTSSDGLSAYDRQIERLLVKHGLSPKKWDNLITKPFLKVLDGMETLSTFLETQPKVASSLYLRSRFPNMPEGEIRHLVTTLGGSPSFLRRGKLHPFYNGIFLFSGAIKEGIRADLKYAIKHPAQFAAKIAFAGAILPKTLMWGAGVGVFGDGIKRIMDGASEYDKTNYHIIPLGLTKDGQSVYLRVPLPEAIRYVGGVYWKMLTHEPGQSLEEIFSLSAGQVPTLNPAFGVIQDSVEFLSGRNPYDSFRQRPIMDDATFSAGGWDKWKAFMRHLAKEFGAGGFIEVDAKNGREAANTLEKIYGIPLAGPLVSRFVKVTDQGHREKEVLEEKAEKKESSKAILRAREAARKVFRGEKLTAEDRKAVAKKKRSYKNELKRLRGGR